jgi:(S)-ureidoglycine-glyoxylate aminotransferase
MTAGARAMGLKVFGDDAHRMTNVTGVWIPEGLDGEAVRAMMRDAFQIEIGTAFGPCKAASGGWGRWATTP